MDKLLIELYEIAETNRKAISKLKDAAIICQMYELAAPCRDIEKELSDIENENI